jgi:hypothetical protein
MAEPGLIGDYLGVVESRLAHRSDLRELLDEMADHLHESVERAEAGGMARLAAERTALERFGDPRLTASLLASVPTKGFDMNAVLDRSTGVFALVAALSWIAAMVAYPYGFSETMVTYTATGGLAASLLLGLAVALTGTTMILLTIGLGDGFGRLGAISAVAAGVATIFATVVPWYVVVWAPALAICLAVTVARGARAPVTRGIVSVLLFAVAPVLLLASGFASLVYETSSPYETRGEVVWGRADLVELIALEVIGATIVVGLAVLARRLVMARAGNPSGVATA